MAGGDRGVALGRVTGVRLGERHRVDGALRPPGATGGLEPADELPLGPADEPVGGRHRRAVVEERRVLDDDGIADRVPDDDLEAAGGRATEERRHGGEIGGGHLVARGAAAAGGRRCCAPRGGPGPVERTVGDELGPGREQPVGPPVEGEERPDAGREPDEPRRPSADRADDDLARRRVPKPAPALRVGGDAPRGPGVAERDDEGVGA